MNLDNDFSKSSSKRTVKKMKAKKLSVRYVINIHVLKKFLSKVFGGAFIGIEACLKPCFYTKYILYHRCFVVIFMNIVK